MKTVTCFDYFASPLGRMLLATDGDALTGAWFDGQRHQPPLGAHWHRRDDLPILRQAASEFAAYFAGGRTRFELALAPAGTPFQRAVWDAIAAVPCGETIAYRELALRVGRPAAVRAAAAATGRNPLSIVIPCHRIVGANGALTGYAGGLERKRWLLLHERAVPAQARMAPSRREGAQRQGSPSERAA